MKKAFGGLLSYSGLCFFFLLFTYVFFLGLGFQFSPLFPPSDQRNFLFVVEKTERRTFSILQTSKDFFKEKRMSWLPFIEKNIFKLSFPPDISRSTSSTTTL